jgi:predicted transcriptional regulator
METIALRKKLQNLIGASSQDKLEEIYNSFNDDLYSDEFKAMPDKEFERYEKDGEFFSHQEVNNLIGQLLHSKK